MNLTLTAEQNADRQRLGACVVPGERVRCSKCEIVFDHYCPDCTYVPPRQFSDAAAPCQTCGGEGRIRADLITFGMLGKSNDVYPMVSCPDCRDGNQTIDGIPIDPAVLAGVTETRGGKPIIEIRVFDPGVRFKRSSLRLVAAFVVVARATVTLLPVVNAIEPNGHDVRHVCIQHHSALLMDGPKLERTLWTAFDPLPVAGRDWVAVFEDVT